MPAVIKVVDGRTVIQAGESSIAIQRQLNRAENAAEQSVQSAAFAEEFSGPAYATIAAGEAATTEGQFFRVSNGDTPRTYTRYERTAGGSVVAAPLVTTIALGGNGPGQGTDIPGAEGGGSAREQLKGTLNAAQFGVVLDDGTIDQADALEAWAAAVETSRLHPVWPAGTGTIYSSRPIRLRGNPTYYSILTGEKYEGPGPGVILTRKNTSASKFARLAAVGLSVPAGQGVLDRWGKPHINNTASAIVLTGTSSAALVSDGLTVAIQEAIDEAFLVIHGSNYSFDGLRFEDCQIGWLMIADPDVGTGQSHASFNSLTDFRYLNCSIGGFMCADVGSYYNRIEGHHGAQGQFGLILGGSLLLENNTNRNTFIQNRMARMHVGYAILSGDTNNFFACHTEGGGDAPTNNTYPSPAGLPEGRGSWGWIDTGTKNKFTGCVDEASTNVMYSTDPEAEYLNCGFHVEDGTNKSVLTVPPRLYLSQNVSWFSNGAISILPNTNQTVFGNRVAGAFLTTPRVKGELQHVLTEGGKVSGWRKSYDLGAVASGGTAAFTLWAESSSGDLLNTSGSASFTVRVVGNCQTSNLAHWTEFRILALRSSSRTLTRYYVLSTTGGRATGAGAGDTGEQFTAALSVSGKDLVCTLTAPGRTFARVSATVIADQNVA